MSVNKVVQNYYSSTQRCLLLVFLTFTQAKPGHPQILAARRIGTWLLRRYNIVSSRRLAFSSIEFCSAATWAGRHGGGARVVWYYLAPHIIYE